MLRFKHKYKMMKTITLILFFLATNVLVAQNELLIPDTIAGTTFDLTLQNGTYQFLDGQVTNTMGVNGNILGPTLILNKNDDINITVDNQLDDTTTIHWHGMHVSADNDGGPHTIILPGATWNPSFTVMDRAGTYWYHPHLHEKTNLHVSKGIAGFIIVRDEDEAALELPRTYGVDDFPLVIQTKDFDASNQVVVPSNSDDVLMVNATIDPTLNVPAQVVRLRILNGSSQRVFNIGLSGNKTLYQIGADDGLLNETNALTRLRMAPGERVEILIDMTNMQGQTLNLRSFASELPNGIYGAAYPGMMSMMTLNGYNPNPMNGTDFDIMEINVIAPTNNPVTTIPTSLVYIIPLLESLADITRTLTFTPEMMGPNALNGKFYINGGSFNMNTINYSIPLDNIEIWTISNQSPTAHPFHIHDVHFYVLDRNGVPPPASEQGRKDVILIPAMESARIIMQFTDFANDDVPYMYHCHMLTHEDDGMMGQFEVVDETIGVGEDGINSEDIILYPNPLTKGNATLIITGLNNGFDRYELYDLSGQKLIENRFGRNSKQKQIDFTVLDPGIYILNLFSGDKSCAKKIIKE